MSYASTDERLRRYQDLLAVAIESPEAAANLSRAIVAKSSSRATASQPDGVLDVEKAIEQFRKTLAWHGVDPDEPARVAPAQVPEPIDLRDAPEVVPAAKPTRERPRFRFWAANQIFEPSLGLDDKARLLYLCLCRFAGNDDVCWPGSRTIARSCGFHSRDVAPAIRTLIALGLVELVPGGPGHPHGYRVLPPDRWKQVSPTVETVGVSPHRLQGVSTPSPVA